MIVDDPVDPKSEENDSPILIEGLADTIPKIQKQKTIINVEVTSAEHTTGVSGALTTGTADMKMDAVDIETDDTDKPDEDEGDDSINLSTSELKAIGDHGDPEVDPKVVNRLLDDKSQSEDEVSLIKLITNTFITKNRKFWCNAVNERAIPKQ